MKRIKSLLIVLLAVICILPNFMQEASAASNPYPTTQDADGDGAKEVPCTRYAWQQAYDRLGIALPAWGNAINWYNAAKNSGYSVGTTPRANSIAVWSISTHSWGHVAFVTAVNGSQMTINEGGRTDKESVSNGIVNGQVLPSTVNTTWYGRTLIGFIYLTEKPADSVSWNHYPDKHSVGSTNAVLAARINLNVDISAVSRVGIYLYDYAGKELATCSENTSHRGYNYMNMWFDANAELHYALKAGTPYKYKFYAVVNGKTYYSPVYDFKTSGTHSHTPDAGTVTKSPSCSATGVKTFTCTTCGGTKTETIAKKDHTYKAATCTTPKTCTVCGATTGSALGHTEQILPGKTATCAQAGLTEGKKCSTCGKTLTAQQAIPSPEHKPAAAVEENKVAATASANGSYDSVVYCQNCKKELSRKKITIPATGQTATTKATTAVKPIATTKATTATKPIATTKATTATKPIATTKATVATKATAAPTQAPQIPTQTTKVTEPIEITQVPVIPEATNATESPAYTIPATPDKDNGNSNSTNILAAIVVLATICNIAMFISRKKKKG